jgi:hypothetical protein
VFDDISLTQVAINSGNGGSRRLHGILKIGHPSIQRGNQNGFVHVKNNEKGVKRRSTICVVEASNGAVLARKTLESRIRRLCKRSLPLQHRETEKSKNDRMKNRQLQFNETC